MVITRGYVKTGVVTQVTMEVALRLSGVNCEQRGEGHSRGAKAITAQHITQIKDFPDSVRTVFKKKERQGATRDKIRRIATKKANDICEPSVADAVRTSPISLAF